jgi:hypothetical protein
MPDAPALDPSYQRYVDLLGTSARQKREMSEAHLKLAQEELKKMCQDGVLKPSTAGHIARSLTPMADMDGARALSRSIRGFQAVGTGEALRHGGPPLSGWALDRLGDLWQGLHAQPATAALQQTVSHAGPMGQWAHTLQTQLTQVGPDFLHWVPASVAKLGGVGLVLVGAGLGTGALWSLGNAGVRQVARHWQGLLRPLGGFFSGKV